MLSTSLGAAHKVRRTSARVLTSFGALEHESIDPEEYRIVPFSDCVRLD